MRSVVLPLGAYLFITLGVPFLNGAANHCEFRQHAFEVAVIATALVALRAIVGIGRRSVAVIAPGKRATG